MPRLIVVWMRNDVEFECHLSIYVHVLTWRKRVFWQASISANLFAPIKARGDKMEFVLLGQRKLDSWFSRLCAQWQKAKQPTQLFAKSNTILTINKTPTSINEM